MNKDSIKLDNNTYAVIDEIGNTRIVSTINSNDQETMKWTCAAARCFRRSSSSPCP